MSQDATTARTRRARRGRAAVLTVVVAVTVLLFAATPMTVSGDGTSAAMPLWQLIPSALFQTAALWYLVPGAIVVLRRDGHVVGWLLAANGLSWALLFSLGVDGGPLSWAPRAWQAWIDHWIGYAGWVLTIALLVLFPDGLAQRPARQRRTGRALIAAPALVTVAAMLTTRVGSDNFPDLPANPTGLGFIPIAVAQLFMVPIAIAVVAALIGLWRRARQVTGATRRQYRWVLSAFAVVIVGLASGMLLSEVVGDAAWLPIVVGWLLIPTAFCVAILRYRLYDIDRIISRTVAYALITLVVGGLYALIVVVLPEIFDLRGPLPVAAATLAAAAAFSPARRVIQQTVDRRFNRARYDARRELDAFTTRLRSEVDLDTVIGEIHTLVDTTLQPAATVMWIRGPRRSM